MDAIEAAARRALNYLCDWHCDNQRDVIEELRQALVPRSEDRKQPQDAKPEDDFDSYVDKLLRDCAELGDEKAIRLLNERSKSDGGQSG